MQFHSNYILVEFSLIPTFQFNRRQVKNFSIRKATNPAQLKGLRGSADGLGDSLKKGQFTGATQSVGSAGGPREPSLLTEEEQEALKPQEVKVENPWIYEQTHQEYLDNIKVSIPI